MNINQARNNVIDKQVRPWGGLDDIANSALKQIPRENFVAQKYKSLAFADIEIPISNNAKMLFPKIEGRILDITTIKKHEKVLEIGTGSGYLTAVLSKLAEFVVSIDCDSDLIANAEQKLNILGINNVDLQVADASKNNDIQGKFDVIIISCSMPKINNFYLDLLNIGGRMFVVEGKKDAMSAKLITRKDKYSWHTESLFETCLDVMHGLEETKEFEF